MPHLTIEYSANLRNFGGFSKLCSVLAKTLVAQQLDGKPVYPIGGIRVRAIAGNNIGCFLRLFEAMKQHFAREFDSQGLALSLEIGEFSEAGTWKHNNLHGRYSAT